MLVYIQGLVILIFLVSPGIGKVLHAGKLLSGSSLHPFNRFYVLFLYGDHIHEAYSKWDLTKLLYRGTKFTPFSDINEGVIKLSCKRATEKIIYFNRSCL